MQKTITFDSDHWQIVPKVATEEIITALRKNGSEGTVEELASDYSVAIAVAPQPPEQEAKPVAYGVFCNFDGKEVLQFPVCATKKEAQSDLQMFSDGDQELMTIRPLYTHAPDSAAEIARLKAELEEAEQMHHSVVSQANGEIARLKGMVSEIQAELAKYQACMNPSERLVLKLREANAELLAGLRAVQAVASESAGITGWHLNGDLAAWDEVLPEVDELITKHGDSHD